MKKEKIFVLILSGLMLLSWSLPVFASDEELPKDSIDTIIDSMTPREKIAQLCMIEIPQGTVLNEKMSALISEYNFGGVYLQFTNSGSLEETVTLTDALQKASVSYHGGQGIPALLAINNEGGFFGDVNVGIATQGNMALAATGDPSCAEASAMLLGSEMSALGFNMNTAPLLDVLAKAKNTADFEMENCIGVRAFSDDAGIVSQFGKAYLDGLKESGILGSGQYFPGMGGKHANEDYTVDKSETEIRESDLLPFKNNKDNLDVIIVGPAKYPSFDSARSAILSEKIVKGMLRTELEYNGLVVTDALSRICIGNDLQYCTTQEYIDMINLGNDMLCCPVNFYSSDNTDDSIEAMKTLIDELTNHFESDLTFRENVNTSVKRILTAKNNYGILTPDPRNQEQKITDAQGIVGCQSHLDADWRIGEKAITLLKNEDDVLPISSEDGTKVLVLSAYATKQMAVDYAIEKLKSNGTEIHDGQIIQKNFDDLTSPTDDILNAIAEADVVVICTGIYDREDIEPDAFQVQCVPKIIEEVHRQNKKVVLDSLNLPYDVALFNDADAIVLSYNYSSLWKGGIADGGQLRRLQTNNAIAFYTIMGGCNPQGKLPINVYKMDVCQASGDSFTDEILYPRGTGLSYHQQDTPKKDDDITTKTDKAPATSISRDNTRIFLLPAAAIIIAVIAFGVRKKERKA